MGASLQIRVCAVALAAAAGLNLYACGEPGDRADYYRRTGESCLPGKMCSQSAPRGLRFYGETAGLLPTNDLSPVAVGGTADFTVTPKGGWGEPTAFDVESETEVFTVVGVGLERSNGFRLRANTEGSSLVRVYERGTRLLLDRTTIEARAVTSVAVWLRRGSASFFFAPPTTSNRIFIGSTAAHVTLFGGDTSLVDNSAEIALAETTVAALTRQSWRSASLTVRRAGEFTIVVTPGDGRPHASTFVAVDHVDAIEALDGASLNATFRSIYGARRVDEPIPREGGGFCFRALTDGEALLDAPWRFEVAAPGPTPDPQGACVVFPERGMTTSAPFTLRVTAGDRSRDFSMRYL